MSTFSERVGAVEAQVKIQVGSINDALRNSLWNLLLANYNKEEQWLLLAVGLARDYFKLPIDEVPQYGRALPQWVRERFYSSQWHVQYDIVEYVAHHVGAELLNSSWDRSYEVRRLRAAFAQMLNEILSRELSGYRLVAGSIVPITAEVEVAEIQRAGTLTGRLQTVSEHIKLAAALLGKKPEPEYRNSIKEAISAVEGVCKLITGEKSGGIKDALDVLAKRVSIHSALQQAIKSLYGYSSDKDGIRHALLESNTVGHAEARFMLVACSALVGFLVTEAADANVLAN